MGKFNQFDLSKHPPRLHKSKWRLNEYWYEFDQGKTKSQTTTIDDTFSRSSTDVSGSMSAVNLPAEHGRNKKSLVEVHKSCMAKVRQLSSRMAKSLMGCESKLVSIKRKVAPSEYQKLWAGMNACREARLDVMHKLEEGNFPDEEYKQQECIDFLQTLSQQLQTHLDALQEAFATYKSGEPPIVKKDEEEMDEGEALPEPGCDG